MSRIEKYFITLDKFTLEEYQVWKLLCRYSDYETGVVGYTINQIVIGSDSRLLLTTQKVRTILKKFEKDGYIKFLTSGSKGKDSTLQLLLKDKLFNNELTTIQQQSNNNLTNKSEQLQQIGEDDNNNVTTNQQQSNNTTKKKKKDNKINIDDIDYIWNLYPKKQGKKVAYGKIGKLLNSIGKEKLEECISNYIESVEEDRKSFDRQYMNGSTFFNGRYEDYLEKQKAPTAIGTNKNNKVNNSICNPYGNNTPKVEVSKFI